LNSFLELKEGQKVIINGKSLIVTEDPDILQGFWAMDSDSNEDEYHTSQIEMVIKTPVKNNHYENKRKTTN
jgi:hypothetical protein